MFKQVLVTLDGSSLAEQALPKAVQVAESFGAELTLLRVVNPLLKSYRAGAAIVADIEQEEKYLLEEALNYLNDLAATIREKDIVVNTITVLGRPYQEIVKYPEEKDIDLLVMSTRGETGLTRWLLGSVTDHVIRGVSVPVLVVPAQ